MFSQRNTGIVGQYEEHGDNHPPQELLAEWVAILNRSSKPTTLLVAADMCIDQAMMSGLDSENHIGQAEEILEEIVENHDSLLEYGFEEKESSFGVSTRAILKLADTSRMRNYGLLAGIVDTTIEDFDPYLESLEVLETILDRDTPRYNDVAASIGEYLPLLLIDRAIYRGNTYGINGRLSLQREDKRAWSRDGQNMRWDVGLFDTAESGNILTPGKKLQIKLGKIKQGGYYRRGGITPLSIGKHIGVNDPMAVLESCIVESDSDIEILEGSDDELYTSLQLDEFTQNMLAKIDTQSELS